MITKEELDELIDRIPPLQKTIKEVKKHLEEGDLIKASNAASDDPVFMNYLKDIVNKPIFGFANEVSDAKQIFGILGLSRSRQIFNSYIIQLLAPKKWRVFDYDAASFYTMQSEFIILWDKIVESKFDSDKNLESIAIIIPSLVALCDEIFAANLDNYEMLANKGYTYNEVLKKMSGYTLTQLAVKVAQKWEMDENIIKILKEYEKIPDINIENLMVVKYLHLLIFYILSQPRNMEAGLNTLIVFYPEFVEDINEEFFELVGIE
jgi:HD-like signal output (HDOD) protein